MQYTSPSMNQLNVYNYKDIQQLYPIYLGYQNLYYNTHQLNPITTRVNDPSNNPPHVMPLYAVGQMSNYDHLQNPVTQHNPNLMLRYANPYWNMREYNLRDTTRPLSSIKEGQRTSHVSVHGYNVY